MPRYKVNSVEELHMGLLGLDDEMNVEVAPGISISASTVRDLKTLKSIPCKLRLSWPAGPRYPEHTVKLEMV